MRNRQEIEKELRGVTVAEFLKSAYTAKARMSSGSQYIFDVQKNGTPRIYTCRFQFVRLSFLGLPNQYRAFSCSCPRFHGTGNCHHLLITAQTHAESIGQTLNAETFADFNLSKINVAKMERRLAA